MLAEHQDIVATLQRLVEAAKAEDKRQYAEFAEKLWARRAPREKFPIRRW